MIRSFSIRFAFAVSACALLMIASPLSGQTAAGKPTFNLRGQEYQVIPRDKLIARGLSPPDVPDDENAAWVYIEAMNAMVDPPADQTAFDEALSTGRWPEGEAGAQLAEWLDKNADAIALTRKAAAMPQYYMPLARNDDSDSLVAALLPTLGPMRSISRLMTINAVRERSLGHADVAVDDALVLHQLSQHAAHGTTLIEGLVGVAIAGLAEKNLRWSIDEGQLSADKLTKVSSELDKLSRTQADWEQWVRGEERLSEGHIDDIMDMDGLIQGFFYPDAAYGSPASANPSGWQMLARRLKRLYLPDRLMKKHTRTYFNRLVAAARWDDGGPGLNETDEELMASIPKWNVVAHMMLPSLSRTYDTTVMRRANFERTRVAVAAAAYKKAKGVYPARLADLAPTYLPEIPKDPLTGREIEYSPAADGGSYTGLEAVEGDKARAFFERRKARAEMRRADAMHPWRQLVTEYAEKYQFDEAQRTSADAILKDMQRRAEAYVKSLESKTKPDPEKEKAMTAELTRRLDDLLTDAQRSAVKK